MRKLTTKIKKTKEPIKLKVKTEEMEQKTEVEKMVGKKVEIVVEVGVVARIQETQIFRLF